MGEGDAHGGGGWGVCVGEGGFKPRLTGEGKIRRFALTMVNTEADGYRIIPHVSQVRQREGY